MVVGDPGHGGGLSNVGILAGNLVALNSSAVIDSDRLGTGGTAGEVLTWASGTATWETAGASVSVAAGAGLDVGVSGTTYTLSLERVRVPIHFTDVAVTASASGTEYRWNFTVPYVPSGGFITGDTFTFITPDPIPNILTDTTITRVWFNSLNTENYYIVDPAGTAVRRNQYRGGRLYTIRIWNNFRVILVEPPVGDIQGITTSDNKWSCLAGKDSVRRSWLWT